MLSRIEEIKKHYLFGREDEVNLAKIGEMVLPLEEQFASDFCAYLMRFPESAEFFRTEEATEVRRHTFKDWLLSLLKGPFNSKYYNELMHVGLTHVKRGVPIHWVTASMNFKREYLIKLITGECQDERELQSLVASINKVLDLNLDIMLTAYHEEEMKAKFLSSKMDSALIRFAERFTYGLNVILILALIGLALGVVILFVTEAYHLFTAPEGREKAILTALGTLLIIWVVTELMHTEINYLKGEKFHIEIFISVALIAFIRELLIASIAHESEAKLALMLGAIFVLGLVYFMIQKSRSN